MFGEIEQVLGLAAVVVVVLGLRALFLYFKPYRPCRWCRPGGVLGGGVPARVAGHKPTREKRRRCWRCKGRKLTRRWGAWHVHKARLSLGQAWAERGDE